MASFKKTKNGSWQATISCGRDPTGKQIRKYLTRPTLKEAKSAAYEIELEYEEGNTANLSNLRLSSWMDDWLSMNKNRISPATYQSYNIYINVHFKNYFLDLKVGQITDIHIQKYMNEKLNKLSPTTVRKHMFVLKKIFQDAVKDKNPVKDIKIPSSKKFKAHVVTEEEFNIIFEHFKGNKYEAVVLLSAWCGLRRGEIFALKWDDINWDEKTVRVDESRVISEEGYINKDPKSDNGYRTISTPEYLMNLLLEIKKKGMDKRIFMERPDHFTHVFKQAIDLCKLKDIRFHDMRHYHASWLYKKHIPDHYAAERLGHDIQTLKKIYQHIDADTKKIIESNIVNMLETK